MPESERDFSEVPNRPPGPNPGLAFEDAVEDLVTKCSDAWVAAGLTQITDALDHLRGVVLDLVWVENERLVSTEKQRFLDLDRFLRGSKR